MILRNWVGGDQNIGPCLRHDAQMVDIDLFLGPRVICDLQTRVYFLEMPEVLLRSFVSH